MAQDAVMPSPPRPSRSTSSAGASSACAGGSGLGGAVLVLLLWLDRESISSSEGSLSSPFPRGRLGSARGEKTGQ